jgi:hypothetical protein
LEGVRVRLESFVSREQTQALFLCLHEQHLVERVSME